MSRQRLIAAFQEVGFMVGNTTGFAEYVNLNYLGTDMHSDLTDLQRKLQISIRKKSILKTSSIRQNFMPLLNSRSSRFQLRPMIEM